MYVYTYIHTSRYRKRAGTSPLDRALGSKTIRLRPISRSIRSLDSQSRSQYHTQFILRFFACLERKKEVLNA